VTLDEFRHSLADPAPPPGLPLAVQGLWWDGHGDWNRAHQCAQDQDDAEGAAVHAYLHRKEGDLSNARYWYRHAGRSEQTGPLQTEWDSLARELLGLHQAPL
jgi:hypothetical protein